MATKPVWCPFLGWLQPSSFIRFKRFWYGVFTRVPAFWPPKWRLRVNQERFPASPIEPRLHKERRVSLGFLWQKAFQEKLCLLSSNVQASQSLSKLCSWCNLGQPQPVSQKFLKVSQFPYQKRLITWYSMCAFAQPFICLLQLMFAKKKKNAWWLRLFKRDFEIEKSVKAGKCWSSDLLWVPKGSRFPTCS